MVRYEKKGFSFYKSGNLLDWTWLSRIDGFYECPDPIRLPVLNLPSEQRWVLIDGDGSYVLGEIAGDKFVPQTAKLRAEYVKDSTRRRPGSGPSKEARLFDALVFPEGIRLCRNPIDESDNLRVRATLVRPEARGGREGHA